MKEIMKSIYCIFIFILGMSACNKDTPKFIDVVSPDVTKYVIDHSGNKINSYSKYFNNVLEHTVTYIDQDSIIIEIKKNSSDKIINKEIYFIGVNGYAESSLDSSFNDNGLSGIYNSTYHYSNDFLVSTDYYYKNFGTNPDSGSVTFSYYISGENIISSNVSFPNYTSGCTDYFDYDGNSNIIDVRYFSNGIKGKISKNLITHASWKNGCPAGPSMSVASSDFEYLLTTDNYIAIMKEIYTPCYHLGDTKEVTRTIRTTYYLY